MKNVVLWEVFAILCLSHIGSSEKEYYTVAILNYEPEGNSSSFVKEIEKSLKVYSESAKEAKKQGADVIVLPESVDAFSLEQRYQDEGDKDLKEISNCNSCNDSIGINDTTSAILASLSSIAKNENIYLVANIFDNRPCLANYSDCVNGTEDILAAIVFDNNGRRVPSLGKLNDSSTEVAVFNTSFGSFLFFPQYDVATKEAIEIIQRFKPENVILLNAWYEDDSFWSPVQYFQSWSLTHKVNLIVSNVQSFSEYRSVSLISSGVHGIINYTSSRSSEKPTLFLSKVPVRESYVPVVVDEKSAGNTTEPINDFMSTAYNTTSVELMDKDGEAEVCQTGLCCKLKYKAKQAPLGYYLIAFNGVTDTEVLDDDFVCQELCLLTNCQFLHNCSAFADNANSDVFEKIMLTSNMKSKYQYPVVTVKGLEFVRQSRWKFSPGKIETSPGSFLSPLSHFGINSRCYPQPQGAGNMTSL